MAVEPLCTFDRICVPMILGIGATAARYRYCHRRSFAVFPHQGFTRSGISDIWGKIPNWVVLQQLRSLTSKSPCHLNICLSVAKRLMERRDMLKHSFDASALCEEEVDRPASNRKPRAVWLLRTFELWSQGKHFIDPIARSIMEHLWWGELARQWTFWLMLDSLVNLPFQVLVNLLGS